ncbi:recombinase family protein [Deinococcus sp. SL84]|uniref:recombinase family protein n=1 Tax=Deinococcus sp. SL84 TaxID=2994663 RepID=UPI002273C7C4|nr:recombinase family protein [Deinococcus sp. SL84]MCY1703705.1 recombinase family protein [Deinococcus sp. SL84]
MSTPAVAYYRVSTAKQGQSGLGLEAQRAAVLSYARSQDLTLVEEFTEIETGTRKRRRPQLEEALSHTRRIGGVLLIAKLDRLARNVAVVATLMESGVRFVAVDMPEADNLTIHVMAAVAEREAQLISSRTKAALAARKARGLKLGKAENLTLEARKKGAEVTRQRAIRDMRTVAAYAGALRSQGLTLRAIALQLDQHGFQTRRGGPWSPTQVKRILDRSR